MVSQRIQIYCSRLSPGRLAIKYEIKCRVMIGMILRCIYILKSASCKSGRLVSIGGNLPKHACKMEKTQYSNKYVLIAYSMDKQPD